MFKKVIFLITLIFGTTSSAYAQNIPNFDHKTPDGKIGQTIAFIGEKVAIENVEDFCGEDAICLDLKYHVRYRIKELISGDFPHDTIDFIAFDHYGTPKFSKEDTPIIYVYQTKYGLIHHKYSYDPVYPTKSGSYAFCGDPYTDYKVSEIEELGRSDLTPFKFSPPVKFKLSNYLISKHDYVDEKQIYIRENFIETMRKFAPPAFKIKGNTAYCKMGMSPMDVVNIRMKYEFIPGEISYQRSKLCKEKLNIPKGSNLVKDLRRLGYYDCIKEK